MARLAVTARLSDPDAVARVAQARHGVRVGEAGGHGQAGHRASLRALPAPRARLCLLYTSDAADEL